MRNWSRTVNECKECGRTKLIVNKKYGLCIECNYFRLHGETTVEAAIKREKQQEKEKNIISWQKQKKAKLKPKKKKVTGELKMFQEIWAERDHFCQNKNCGVYLGEVLQPIFFSHRKSKGAYPALRLCKDNIDLLCAECHHKWDFGNRKLVVLE